MGQDWQNPQYEYYRQQRRRILLVLVVLIVGATAFAAFWLLRRGERSEAAAPSAGEVPVRTATAPQSVPDGAADAPGTRLGDAAPDPAPASGDASPGGEETRQPVASGGVDDFDARKALALDLYRRNELEQALVQVQAALALRPDAELLELQARLRQEIRVQRNYDGARTANFVVLFDGYEHDEIKYVVLGILKDAYAEIGQELDYFPERPITVILYTAKDFTEITQAPVWSGGLYGRLDGKIRVPVQGAEGQEATLRRVLFHECAHALLYALVPDCPLWLNEGLAQYFSGDEPVNVGQAIPLTLLVGGFPRDARLAQVAYAESLQAVSDLVDEHGMSRLRRLLDELGAGKTLEAGFAAAYGDPFSRWAAQWRPVSGGNEEEEPSGQAGNEG